MLYIYQTKQLEIMKKGQKLKYTGKGFLGFTKNRTKMTFISQNVNYYLVDYLGDEMLVRKSEVEEF